MATDKIDELYDALKADGLLEKDRDNFRSYMLASGKQGYLNRLELYNALKADGLVSSPSYEEFGRRLGLVPASKASSQPPATAGPVKPISDATARQAAVKPAVESSTQPAQPEGWKPSPIQQQEFQRQMDAANARMKKQGEEFQQRMEGIRKGSKPGAFMGEREFNPGTGEIETAYYTTQGERVPTRMQQSKANTEYHQWWENNTEDGQRSKEQRLQREFDDRLTRLWQRHDPSDGENAAEQAWSAAETRQKAARERNAKRNWDSYAAMGGGREMRVVTASMNRHKDMVDHLTNFDLDRLMNDSWDNLGEEGQKALIDDCYQMLRYRNPGADELVLYNKAKDFARQQSDLRLYNLAVEKNLPKSNLEYLMRKIGDMNMLANINKGLDVSSAKTTGDMAAYEAANERYRHDGHKVLDVTGMVAGFALDPTAWLSAGVGGAATRAAMWAGGRWMAGRGATAAVTQAASRQFATSMTGRGIGGVAGGTANFGIFEGVKEMENQFAHGGKVATMDENGNLLREGRYVNEGYSAGAVAGQFGHGLIMGGAVGWLGPVSGNVSDKLVKGGGKLFGHEMPGIANVYGKAATRAGVYTGATVLEGTIFSVPEWIEGKRDGFDVWTDNMAMMVGFKAKHILKSAGGVLGDLKASFDSPADGGKNRLDFESRLRMRMDAPSDGGLALTKDEEAELKRYGYDLRGLVESAERTGDAKEGGLIARNAPEIVSRLTDMVRDTRVSEAARAKMYYYATGRKLSESAIMRGELFEDGNGGFIVESQGANGVITSRSFKNRKAADLELERIKRQVELNSIEFGERYQKAADFESRLQDACRTVAEENGWDMVEVYRTCEEARRNHLRGGDKQFDEVQQNILRKVTDAMGEFEETGVTDAIRGRINEKYGVDIDGAIRKEANRRTFQEQGAIDEYLNELIPDKAKEANPVKDVQAEDITNQKLLTDESASPADGEPIVPRFDSTTDAAPDYGPHHSGGEQVPIGRAVMKYQDRPVEVLNGRVVVTEDGTMVDKQRSDASIVVRDIETGKVEMVAPEAILSYEDYAGDPVEASSEAAMQSAASGAVSQPGYGKGTIKIRHSDGTETRGWLTGYVDENGNHEYYVEGDLQHLHYASDHELDNMLSEYQPDEPVQTQEVDTGVPSEALTDGVNDVISQHGNRPEQDNDGLSSADHGGAVAGDAARSVEADRDRSDIRVYEEGLAAGDNAYSNRSERNRRETESERLVKIARENGQHRERKDILALGTRQTKATGESEVVIDHEHGQVYKIKDPYAKGAMKPGVNPEDAIFEHLVHNKYFPETAYRFEGISDDLGDARIILSQGYVESVGQATQEQIEAALAEKGLTRIDRYHYGNDEVVVTDVTGDNALVGADGKVYFIDPIINFKRPVRKIVGEMPEKAPARPGTFGDGEILTENRETGTGTVSKTEIPVENGWQRADNGFIPIDPAIKLDENGNIDIPAPETQQEQTSLQRIPRDEKGEPVFELAESPEAGWDALVEFSEGDATTAKEIADTMAEEKRKAYEKAQKQKPKGKTPTEILASKKAISAGLAQAEQEYNLWQQMANVEQRRQDAIRSQQEAEARQRAAERAEAEKAERAAREEAARQEREALEGIPEWHLDSPENARKRGVRRYQGQMIIRQEPVTDNNPGLGKVVNPLFKSGNNPISAKGRIFIGDIYDFQPSHIDGIINPKHFLPEAQPKKRHQDGGVSVNAAISNAENFRPEMALRFEDAFNGAPVVNTRREICQGNGRGQMYRYLYELYPEKGKAFKQTLIDNADKLGISPKYIASLEYPMPSIMLTEATDADVIRLGNIDDKAMTSGGIERIKPENVARTLGEDMRTFANQLLRSTDDEASFGQLVDRNGAEVLKWMAQKGAITNTQYQSAFDSKGNLTAEARNDLQKVLYQAVFRGGSQQLEEMFDKLPAKAQRAILSTAFRDMDSPLAGKMLPEIQASISAYNLLMNDPAFAEAKNMEQVLRAVEAFKQQIALDDRFEQYMPADNFSNFALHLAGLYKANDMSQSTIAGYFNQMYDLAQGRKAATLFEEADATKYPLAEVIKKVLGIDYQPAKNGNNNVANGGADVALRNQDRQGGELRGNEPPAGREQTEAGTEPSERGGGITGDSRGSGIAETDRGNQGETQTAEQNVVGRTLNTDEAQDFIAYMEESAEVAPELPLTPQNWANEFGTDGIIKTPIGEVKQGDNQYLKLAQQGRNGKLGMIKPTLERPSIIIEDERPANDGNQDRATSYVFIRTFVKKDGSRYYHFASITVSKDGKEVVISSQERSANRISKLLQQGKVAWIDERFSLHPTTQIEESVPLNDSNKPTSTDNQPALLGINSSELSSSKEDLVWKHTDDASSASDVADGLFSPQGNMSDPVSEGTDAPQTSDSDRKVTDSASEKQENGAESSVQPTDNKGAQTIQTAVEAASAQVNTEPTPAQTEAGNYKKGHVTIGEFDITIENPAGSVRKGVDADGKEWSTTMANAYGYIKGTEGVDGDHIDVFLHQDMDEWNGRKVYVVDQTNTDGSFDEHKVMLGFNEESDALSAYLANYDKTWANTHPGLRITETNIDDFNKWVQSSRRKTKPFADYKSVKAILYDNQGNPIDENRNLIIEDVKSIADITDADFTEPTRTIGLPTLPEIVQQVLSTNGKRVIIKKNIFGRNALRHDELTPEMSRAILNEALYNPTLYGKNKPLSRPNNWIVINVPDGKGNNKLVVLEVNDNKDNVEIVHWHEADERGLEKIKRQAEREDGQLLILPSETSEEAGALSGPTFDSPSDGKVNNSAPEKQGSGQESLLQPSDNKDEQTNKSAVEDKFTEFALRYKDAGSKGVPAIEREISAWMSGQTAESLVGVDAYLLHRICDAAGLDKEKALAFRKAIDHATPKDLLSEVWELRDRKNRQDGSEKAAFSIDEKADGNQAAYDVAKELVETAGIEVVEVSDAEARAKLDGDGEARLMGSRTDKKMAKVSEHYAGRELDANAQGVVDVFSGKADNIAIEVERADGKRRVIMRQGREPKAGTKHSLYRHFETRSNYITADDISMIPEIIAKGERTVNGKNVAYDYVAEDGTRLRVMTEIHGTKEQFTNLLSNREPLQEKSVENTQLSAHRSDAEVSDAKLENNTESDKKAARFSISNRDAEYLAAVEHGDMATAQRLVDEAASEAGYLSESEYQGTSAYNGAAPFNGYGWDKAERKEKWENDEYEGDWTLGDNLDFMGEDTQLHFLLNHPNGYYSASSMQKESINALRSAIRNGERKVKVYRSVPSDVKEGKLRDGDWVTPSLSYAKDNAAVHGWGRKYRIIEQEVDFDELWWDGNDVNEWGYDSGSNMGYKNTRNNRKLLDAVTYDDNGNVIPLYERFNQKKSDVRYLRNSEGVVYGWTEGGKVYLNRDAMNPETPLHEYTHLWDEMVRRENPELWERGKELMKQTPLWDEVMNDPNYADIRNDEDAVASEVHSRLTGKRGAERIDDMMREAASEADMVEKAKKYSLLHQLKRWLQDMFKGLKKSLSKWTKQDLRNLRVEDFADLTLRDLAEGMNPKNGDKNLVAVHNLSADKLKEALELGGFPMPSIAITKTGVGHSGFGEISLVFGKGSIDPANRLNKVYSRDAWTPTFPSMGYKLNSERTSYIYNRANKARDMRLPFFRAVDFHPDNYERIIDGRGNGSLVEAFKDDYGAKQLFLYERGNPVEKYEKREEEKYSPGKISLFEKVLKTIGEDRLRNDDYETLEPGIKRIVSAHQGKDFDLMKPLAAKALVSGTIRKALDYADNGNTKTETDIAATQAKIDARVDSKEYQAWLEEMFAGVVEKKGIRNDRDMFTPSGESRKWESLYDAVTLDNVVKAMQRQSQKGGEGFFGGSIFGAATKEIKDIEKLRMEAEERIKSLPQEEYDAEEKRIKARLEKVSVPSASGSFSAMMDFEENVKEAVVKSHTADGIYRHLHKIYPDMTMGVAEEIADIVKDIQLMSTRYLEAKPQRAVGFEEVRLAVVPEGAPREVIDGLKSFGVPVRIYERGNEQQRSTIISQETSERDLRFHAAMSRDGADFDALRDRAVAERGIVMPGLNETEVKVVEVPRHDFEGTGKEALQAAEKWAKENIVGVHKATDSSGDAFDYSISNDAVEKYVSRSATAKSENIGVHLAVLKKLPEIIGESIEAEVHPDYTKRNGKRNADSDVNPKSLVHRFYGAVNIEGIPYRVKTTMREYADANMSTVAHSYEVTQIELLEAPSDNTLSTAEPLAMTSSSVINAANLLQGVEKSYDSGKKLLEESRMAEREGGLEPSSEYGVSSERDLRFREVEDDAVQISPEAKSNHAERLAKKFNTPIRIVNDLNELKSTNAERQTRMRQSKGFYDASTGEVVVVVPNNATVEDMAETVFHEVVAHRGLREMIGEESYDAFCDEVYNHLKDDLKKEVDEETTRRFVNEPGKGYEHHRRVAVDEMFGRMSEKGFEDFSKAERGIWAKLKTKVLEAINKFLGSLKLPKWVKLGDNELRYMLWRSHERLRSRGSTPNKPSGMDYVDMARDAAKREELGLRRNEVVRERNSAEKVTADRIEKLFDEAVAGDLKGKPVEVGRLTVAGREYLERLSGLKMKDEVSFVLNPSDLVHMYRDHFGINEKDKGNNIPLTTEDIRAIANVVSNPERVIFGVEPNGLKRNLFYFLAPASEGAYNLLEIYGDRKGNLTAKTFYKTRKGVSQRALSLIKSEHLTSVTDGATLSDGAKLPKFFENPTIAEEESFEYRFRDGETGDIWKDRSVGLEERITNAAIRLSDNQKGDITLRNDAQKAVVNNLQSLLHEMRNRGGMARRFAVADRKVEAGVVSAMNAQAMFDRVTVKRVSDLARILMQNGYLSGITSGEMQRLLSVVKNATAMHDISDSVQKIMDIMINNQLRNAEGTLRQLLSIRGSKVDARGVEVQGMLDVEGQRTMEVVKKALSLPEDDINDRIAEALNRMGDPDQTIADQAALEYAGLHMALNYVQNIANSKAEEKALRDGLKTAKEEHYAGRMTDDAYKQFVETTEDAIRKNKIERSEAYFNLVGRLSDSLRGSIENAKAFREAEKARVNEIHHNANSDMEGRPTNEHHKDDWKDKIVNNDFIQVLFAPLCTFDQILRVFGNKSANGEGYLWHRFMRGWVDCRNKELQGVKEKFAQLDEKAEELFGKGKTWGNLIRMERKLPKATVSFRDGGEMRDHELTQGNLLYIYMVDKMTDGRMKLRRMGITEDDIASIEDSLDPRFKAIGDWLQDEFLVATRNEYNETHKRMFGASMAAIENYFPLKILANARIDKEEDVNQQNMPEGITTKTGSIIKRRVNNLALDITGADALSVILDHITQMEHWNAYAEWNRDLNTLRTYKRFRNQVINMTTVYGGGRKLWEKFNDLFLMAAGEYRPPVSRLNKNAVNLAKGVTAAKVSFRMYTALKQFLSAPAYAPEISTAAIAKSIVNPYGDFKWCMENLPIFRERWHSRISGDPRLLKSDMDWKMWRSRIMEISSRIGMTPNAFVDAVTVSIGAKAMYETRLKQYLKEGYPTDVAENRAMQDATILFNQTQQSSESPFLSTMQVDKDWLSTLFTMFRNSSMSYTRQEFDAMRNLKRNLTPGQRARSIEFMTKQILRDWGIDPDAATDAERGKAEDAAKNRFRRQIKKDVMRIATFGFILPALWNLGPYLPYIFFGNNDDEKDKMWDDALTHAYFGSLEGLTGGDVMSSFGNMAASGEWNRDQLSKDMPLMSDINTIYDKFIGGKNAEAINDILNLLVQMGVGMNPQSITDAAIAIIDACGDDPVLSHETAIFVMRVLQVPQSQLDKLYFDEIDMSGEEASKLTPAQLAQRYAEYQVKRGTPLAPWTWGDEERLGKYEDLAKDRMKKRLDAQGDAKIIEAYADFEARYKAVSEKAKKAKALMKTDYTAAAQAHAELQQDPDFIMYQRFGGLDKQLSRISKMWLTSKTPEEANLVATTISSYRAGIVKVLQAGTAEARQSAMRELTALMNGFHSKYQSMHPRPMRPNR